MRMHCNLDISATDDVDAVLVTTPSSSSSTPRKELCLSDTPSTRSGSRCSLGQSPPPPPSSFSTPPPPSDISRRLGARSREVWYSDGNLILRVVGSPNECRHDSAVLFKVFRGILVQHSSLLSEKIIPQTANDALETDFWDDGESRFPVVTLNDSPKEMIVFLKALHDSSFASKPTNIETITAFLRLGTKYGVEHLRRRAVDTLALDFPSTLQAYDLRFKLRAFTLTPNQLIQTLNLAREHDLTQILPALLYRCSCALPLSYIIDGCPPAPTLPADDRTAVDEQTPRDSSSTPSITRIADPRDIHLILTAHERLFSSRSHTILSFLRDVHGSPQCPDPTSCGLKRYGWLARMPPRLNDPLNAWFAWDKYAQELDCHACVRHAQFSFERERMKLWDELPGYFELRWGEMQRDEEGAGGSSSP